MNLNGNIYITVCKDGFLSVRFGDLVARLGAGLPFHSTENVDQALELIAEVGELKICADPSGTTVEYCAPNWDVNKSIEQMIPLAELFKKAEKKLGHVKG